MSIKRRSVLKGMLATGASIATLNAPAVHAQAAPFKLGLLTVKTGPLAQGGIQMEQGVLTYLKETNNTMAGRKVEFFSADTGGSPAGTKTKVQELVEQNASLALKLVDYVHVMSKGQVVYSSRPEELWANDEIKHSYLGI